MLPLIIFQRVKYLIIKKKTTLKPKTSLPWLATKDADSMIEMGDTPTVCFVDMDSTTTTLQIFCTINLESQVRRLS